MNATNAPRGFLLERLWVTYSDTDNRRRHAFYTLYSAMVVFGLLWVTQQQSVALPFLQTSVDTSLAFALMPAFLGILAGRYIYLSAHAFVSYLEFLNHFQQEHAADLAQLGYDYTLLHTHFKRRDMTENINIFMFPMRILRDPSGQIRSAVRVPVAILTNLASVMSIALPLVAYVASVAWLASHLSVVGEGIRGVFLLLFYAIAGVLLLLLPIYYFYRTRKARQLMRENLNW